MWDSGVRWNHQVYWGRKVVLERLSKLVKDKEPEVVGQAWHHCKYVKMVGGSGAEWLWLGIWISGFPSYLCILATAINVDTFRDVSKLHFPLQLNKNIKKRKNPPTSFLGRLSEIDVKVASTPPGTLLVPIEVELLTWNQIQVHLGCSLLCSPHCPLATWGAQEQGQTHHWWVMLILADPAPSLWLGKQFLQCTRMEIYVVQIQ